MTAGSGFIEEHLSLSQAIPPIHLAAQHNSLQGLECPVPQDAAVHTLKLCFTM